MKILFLTETGSGIGFGHIMRTGAVERYLKEIGFQTDLLCYDRDAAEPENWMDDLSWIPVHRNFDVVFVDSYLADEKFFETVRSEFRGCVALDDYNRIVYPVDLLINPNVFFSGVDYSKQSAKCIGGKDYIVLRDAFRKFRNSSRPAESGVVITLGGSDFRRLLPRLASLSRHRKDVRIVCPETEMQNTLRALYPDLTVFGTLDDAQMLDVYLSAEVVVSGCGQSLHELAFLGKKTIGVFLDEDQRMNRDYYLSTGFLGARVDWDDPGLVDVVAGLVRRLTSVSAEPFRQFIDPERNMENYARAMVGIMEAHDR